MPWLLATELPPIRLGAIAPGGSPVSDPPGVFIETDILGRRDPSLLLVIGDCTGLGDV